MSLYNYTIKTADGQIIDDNCILIECEDGSVIEIYARRTDGFISVSAYRGTLKVLPRGANSIYVQQDHTFSPREIAAIVAKAEA